MQSTPEDVRETERIERDKKRDSESPSRKLKLLRIRPEMLLELLMPAEKRLRRTVQFEGMPEDAQLENVSWDWESQTFAIAVRSDTFNEVPIGMMLPALLITGRIVGI